MVHKDTKADKLLDIDFHFLLVLTRVSRQWDKMYNLLVQAVQAKGMKLHCSKISSRRWKQSKKVVIQTTPRQEEWKTRCRDLKKSRRRLASCVRSVISTMGNHLYKYILYVFLVMFLIIVKNGSELLA